MLVLVSVLDFCWSSISFCLVEYDFGFILVFQRSGVNLSDFVFDALKMSFSFSLYLGWDMSFSLSHIRLETESPVFLGPKFVTTPTISFFLLSFSRSCFTL